MNCNNPSETERVRRYLLHKVIHSGTQPVRLPTEMSLVETLQLSRVTVRRAINDLINGGYIKKIPGKQGIYTNPAMAEVTMHSIAVLKKNNYFDCRTMSILGAMSDELMRNNCLCSLNFFQTDGGDCGKIAAELSNCGFDCILAFTVYPPANELLKRNLPIIIVETPGYPHRGDGNFAAFDNDGFGRIVAGKMIGRKLKKVLFFGDLAEIRQGFQDAGKDDLEITVFEEYLNKDALKTILKNGDFSGIAVMTREVGMRTLYDALHELPEIPKPELFLFPWKESELFKRSNPEFYTDTFDCDAFSQQLQSLGRTAAQGIMQIINDLPVNMAPVNLQ